MNNLIIGSIVYNEEHRFLEQYLKSISQLTNKIVIIDDGSTDNSLQICSKYTSYIFQTNRLFSQNEGELRSKLWEKTSLIAQDGDFIFNSDCDEIFTKNSLEKFPETLYDCNKLNGDAIGWKKYDMWDKNYYRSDNLWTSHLRFWIWCVKYRKNKKYYWSNRKLHVGSIPINSYFSAYPSKLQIQHWAYSTPELRQQKVEFYKKLDPNAQWGIKEQYDSILDENPNLIEFKDNFEEPNE